MCHSEPRCVGRAFRDRVSYLRARNLSVVRYAKGFFRTQDGLQDDTLVTFSQEACGMDDCIFCKIGKRELPAKLVYEDPELFAFEDIAPQAPTHILICPRKHVAALTDSKEEDSPLLGRALLLASRLAAERKLGTGYRVVVNNGRGAGQTVFHLHLHLLGGRDFRWPPG
jgi:histidine triad (HIT) family protein